jgi:precorrin-2 dehydrogenase/sirohydrochlorin ferrochelatase
MGKESAEECGRGARYPLVFYLKGHALIFGGGKVGMRKAASLSSQGVEVKVVDRRRVESDQNICVFRTEIDKDSFKQFINDETSLVVCALDDPYLNEVISQYCAKRSIPVNVATSRGSGTVAFPSIIELGNDVVTASSKGTCPQCSYALRRYIEKELPNLPTFSRIVHELYAEGSLSRKAIAKILDDQGIMEKLREGDYNDAMRMIRRRIG